jgi:G3E family GTPase
VVEASGISEPGPVAKLFTRGNASARYVVDALVTVVDAHQFSTAFGEERTVERRGATEGETRPLSDLLVEQIELANVVLLNKTDLVSGAELATVEELVHGLRPDADIVRTQYSAVDPDELLGRRLYDPARAAEAAGWRQVLAETEPHDGSQGDADDDHGHDDHADHDDHDDHGHDDHADHDDHDDHDHGGHSHPEEAYGVTSFAYRRRRPFDPERVAAVLSDLPASVVRSKGTLWVAGSELAQGFSQAGPSAHVEATGPWVATLPEFERDAYRRNRGDLTWDDEWGDRRTELVFIGRGIDEAALVDRLDDCLLADEAVADYDPAAWDAADRFPTEPGTEVRLSTPEPN